MSYFKDQCYEILDTKYGLEKISINDFETIEPFYRIKDKFYILFIEGKLSNSSIFNLLSKVEKIYKLLFEESMYVLVIGETSDIFKRKECLYCYDWNCYVNLFLLYDDGKTIFTDASINFGGPNYRQIIKELIKKLDFTHL